MAAVIRLVAGLALMAGLVVVLNRMYGDVTTKAVTPGPTIPVVSSPPISVNPSVLRPSTTLPFAGGKNSGGLPHS